MRFQISTRELPHFSLKHYWYRGPFSWAAAALRLAAAGATAAACFLSNSSSSPASERELKLRAFFRLFQGHQKNPLISKLREDVGFFHPLFGAHTGAAAVSAAAERSPHDDQVYEPELQWFEPFASFVSIGSCNGLYLQSTEHTVTPSVHH